MKRFLLSLALVSATLPALAATKAENLFQQGQVYVGQKNYDKALVHFLQATAADPEYAAPHVSLAILYGQRKQFDKAHSHLDTALKLNPKGYLAHKVRGMVFKEQGNATAAVTAFQTYLAEIPADKLRASDRQDVEALIAKLQAEAPAAETAPTPAEGTP
jgi:Tfp pilus assembly protein PilF